LQEKKLERILSRHQKAIHKNFSIRAILEFSQEFTIFTIVHSGNNAEYLENFAVLFNRKHVLSFRVIVRSATILQYLSAIARKKNSITVVGEIFATRVFGMIFAIVADHAIPPIGGYSPPR
jgi:hypothetical protein